MNWTGLNSALQNYLEAANVGDTMPANLAAAVPTIVDNAELRIYRDVDFLATRGQNNTASTTPNVRTFSMLNLTGQTVDGTPVAYVWPVIVEGIALVLPAGANFPPGQLVNLEPASLDFIDMAWPLYALAQPPAAGQAFYAMLDDRTAVIMPTPDAAYRAVVSGTWRPAPMSASNATTWLGTYAPDLLFAGCMVQAEGYVRNFGAQADDPRGAMSWATTYQQHWLGTVNEERRRKGLSPLPTTALPPSMSDQPR